MRTALFDVSAMYVAPAAPLTTADGWKKRDAGAAASTKPAAVAPTTAAATVVPR
jgi:hypothetical protein